MARETEFLDDWSQLRQMRRRPEQCVSEVAPEAHGRQRRHTPHRIPSPIEQAVGLPEVMVSMEDAAMIRKVHKILAAGKNVEIRNDKDGKPKVLKVSKEIA